MVCALLERFGGYTYSTLMDEDPEFLRTVKIADHGRGGGEGGGGD